MAASPEASKVKALETIVEELRLELFRAKTSGQSGPEKELLTAKLSGTQDEKNEQLRIALHNVNHKQFKECVDAGAKVDHIVPSRRPKERAQEDRMLHQAAKSGQLAEVTLQLDRGVSVELLNGREWTALHKACAMARTLVASSLLLRRADANARNNNGETPLMLAMGGHGGLLALIEICGQDITSLMIEEVGRAKSATVADLAEKKAADGSPVVDFKAVDSEGKTAAHHALLCPHPSEALKQADLPLEVVMTIIDREGEALDKVAQKDIENIEVLIKNGADLDFKYENGKSRADMVGEAADAAKDSGNTALAKILQEVQKFAAVNELDDEKFTPLMRAVQAGNEAEVTELLNHGAHVNMVGLGDFSPLIMAANDGRTKCVELLLQEGANVHHVDHDGCTALSRAAGEAQTECVKLLLQNGAKCDTANNQGKTALMNAAITAEVDERECFKLILQRVANCDQADSEGITALMVAANMGHIESAKLLLEKGANVNKKDKKGNTPSYYAGNSKMRDLLKEHGGME